MSVELLSVGRANAALTRSMRHLARKELELDRRRAELNSRLEAVKGVYEQRITALERAVAREREGIEQFCRAQRDLLIAGSPKSIRTPYGRVGFRRNGSQVVLAEGVDDEGVCCALRERGLDGFVRVRQSLDRTTVKRALEAGETDEVLLAACGIRLGHSAETFYCVIERVVGGGGIGR